MMEINELQIEVPWGHLAAKIWGNRNNPFVLVFHGIMDNAGSFDRLIPLLPQSFCYICFDLPGHGKSSHFPPFFPLHTLNFVLTLRLIVQYFNREKYIIMGHSFGATVALYFSQIYPEYVEKLMILDAIYGWPLPSSRFKQALRRTFDFTLDLNEKMNTNSKPSYMYETALKKIKDGRRHSFLKSSAAEALLQRGIRPAEDGKYTFTVDPRLKYDLNLLHDFPYVLDLLRKFPIDCPVLIILARENENQHIYMKSVLIFFKKCKNFSIKYVDGAHDVHNNNPEIVAPYVTSFLLKMKGKL